MERKIIELTPEELRRLQLSELDILIELDRICRKHHLEYRIDGGTLLGAVRHKGFIPWDDDIDVTMPRAAYVDFCRVCETELGEGFFLQNWDTDPNYRRAFGRLMKKNTRLVPEHGEWDKSLQGICIDIFPYDYLPDDPEELERIRKLDIQMQRVIYAPGVVHRPGSPAKRAAFWLYSLYPMERLKRKHAEVLSGLNGKKTKLVKCFAFTENRKHFGFGSRWFDELIELEFEGRKFLAPKGYDGFLTELYGDYMQLPPVEQRKGKSAIVELDFGEG